MRADSLQSVHVLHVVPGLHPGGMETSLARVVRGLADRGMEHTVACLTGEPVIAGQFPPCVRICCMNAKPNDPSLPWRLWRLIQRIRPTVVHARNWGAWPDVALARLLAGSMPPLVFSFHGFAAPGLPPLRRRVAFRVLSRLTTFLFTVSEATREMLIRDMGWPRGRVGVIPNGVDAARFSPRPREPSAARTVVIGTVGSLTPVKNHALLIRAFAGLAAPGLDAELRIAGEGPERPNLEQLVASLGLSGSVRLVGHLEDIPRFLRELDIFVLPSLSEAHPNALLEAMSCAIPCVASDVGGVSEVLGQGSCGRLVRPGDREGLVQALRELVLWPKIRASEGDAARRRVLDQYSMDRMVEAYARLYWDLASGIRPVRLGRDNRAVRFEQPRVLLLGPLPPLTGGMATVADNLRRSRLAEECRLVVVNNGKMTPPGRPLLAGVLAQVRLLGRVAANCLRWKAQVAHIHTCAMFSFWRDCLHMLAIRALGCKVIWHIHDGSFAGFLAKGPPLRRGGIRAALRMGSAVIVLSRQSLEALRPLAPEVRWVVVPNAVPVPARPARPSAGPARFLFLGNLTRRKGAFDLVDAMETACLGGMSAVLRLAGGEVTAGQREELARHISGLKCRDGISLLGVVRGPDKDRALEDSDCLVLPSYVEGLPMAVLEGMAYGLPVIATRVGAIPDVVREGQEGFLVSPGDVQALSQRMASLAADAELRRRMGQAARSRLEEGYSLDRIAGRILDLYKAVIAREDSPPWT